MTDTNTNPAVTRNEIIDAVEDAFRDGSATTQEILDAAIRYEAPAELQATLQRLPDRTFGHVRDLWDHLPDVPIGD
ncbi:DUF2795 domain-containing protein [Amycolatopsis cihanbeyliensis]|uniref:Uncharacterized protein DUF2795 n=1 Tax=Amycolatopsis cihanbeyliensis TaxID=1128664 RepID=A0A542DF59_AMYCI|nr:DUF2795 domain-containing protein [Amycolatopsis cihanbeyliensis]TQJ01711.1 uncharacterized protein DUF2795 [Amycolatopsis cihanbeyliensis]